MRSIYLIFLFLLIPFFYIGAKHFWRGETIGPKKVCKKWGRIPFDSKKFKGASNESLRAKMACSLLEGQKKFIGKDRSEIRKILGDHDGFYFSDMFPAYMIESAATKEKDSWQIVFMLDRKNIRDCCPQKLLR